MEEVIITSLISLSLGILSILLKKETKIPKDIRLNIGISLITFSLALASSVLLFYRQIETLNAKLDFYENSEGWRLPELTEEIDNAIQAFNLSMEERQLFDEQKNRIDEFEKENLDLKNRIYGLENRNDYLKSLILSPTKITLSEKNSTALIKNDVYLGLIYVYDSSVDAYIDNSRKTIYIGKTIPIYTEELSCDLMLMSVEEESAVFNFICE